MVVNGGQSAMIHGILTTQMLSVVNWASVELKATKLQHILDRDPIRYGWMMCNARVASILCKSAVTVDGARTTAVTARMLV